MIYIIKNIKIPVSANPDPESALKFLLGNMYAHLQSWKVIRRALDTRKKNHPLYVYTIQAISSVVLPPHPDIILRSEPSEMKSVEIKLNDINPIIIGMGPAGLFCALAMVEKGLKPVIFDRGDQLSARTITVDEFWKNGKLDPESNVQFGEGGAGAFSDGKLTSRSQNRYIHMAFDLLIKFGAPESISWEALPHLGTDGIRALVAKIREYLIEKGCKFNYRSRLEKILVQDGKVVEVTINGISYQPEILVMAIGNSARDSFHMLAEAGVVLEAKPFAVGFRISHSQRWINRSIYGDDSWAELLGAASYRLTAPKAGKGTYSFCMCPGGMIISASSEPKTIVTNGMSYSDRDIAFGNSAIVTVVDAEDYGCALFDGMDLQSKIEGKAYTKGYPAPFQTSNDFISDMLSAQQKINCLFPAVIPYRISELFPIQITQALKQGLKHFDQILPGFISEGILIAPETRTSSPLRIVRDTSHSNCIGINNLYAIGEGSGYAGGIISSAADGLRLGEIFAL